MHAGSAASFVRDPRGPHLVGPNRGPQPHSILFIRGAAPLRKGADRIARAQGGHRVLERRRARRRAIGSELGDIRERIRVITHGKKRSILLEHAQHVAPRSRDPHRAQLHARSSSCSSSTLTTTPSRLSMNAKASSKFEIGNR